MIALHPGRRCLPFQCETRDTIKAIIAEFGRIDGLVNNAGITRDAALARMRRDQWDEVIATNLGSTRA
jgi:3-oxoacyl-[acyl-carrier protein] reductase